ncbi:MAG: MBL fold metallo-hydrolase [Candidatus Melainabacteria bacterium]|nr:MBL fold metallo-hydrolase [Candidatus Melainabacteria bacterium]
MIGFCPLASGSKGNCIYFGTATTKILIDAGISAKLVRERLKQLGVELEEIDAILITHEHTDHIKALDVLGCRMGIPVFANSDTAKAIFANLDECPKFKIFSTGESFEFGDIEVHPFSIQHDAADPVAFVLKAGGKKFGFCADLGFVTTLVASQLKGCDYLYVEANHEPSMVHACARPQVYKQRVLGRQGHLSNAECAQLIETIYHGDLKHIHLAHLSSECNSQDLALKIIGDKLKALGAPTEVSIAFQEISSKPIKL